MKTFIVVLILSINLFATDIKNVKLTDEELIAKIMQLEKREQEADKRIVEAKAKTKALNELEKKVDELSKILQVDK